MTVHDDQRSHGPMERGGWLRSGCPWRWCVCLATGMAWLAASVGAAGSPEPSQIPSAGSANHLWFVMEVEQPKSGFKIAHVSGAGSGSEYVAIADQLALSQPPAALAAWDDQVWLVMQPKSIGGESRREVLSVRAARNGATGVDYFVPHDRLGIAPALPGRGILSGAVGAAQGAVVLLLPAQKDSAGVEAGAGSVAAERGLGRPRLLQLQHEQWVDLDLPDNLPPSKPVRLSYEPAPDRLWLLSEADTGSGLLAWQRLADGTWRSGRLPLSAVRAPVMTSVLGMMALAWNDAADSCVRVIYLRDGQPLELCRLDAPAGAWTIAGVGGELRMLERDAKRRYQVRRIDALSGRIGDAQPLSPQSRPSGPVVFWAVLLALGMTAVLVGLMFRPGPQSTALDLPVGERVAPAGQRLAALLIDLLPSAVLTLLLLRCEPTDLARLPGLAPSPGAAQPALLMLLLTFVHATAGELATGRSIGKALVGCHVVSLSGAPARAWQIIVRNLFKFVVLSIPPLVVFAVVHPLGQGLGDLVGRTAVTRPGADDASQPPTSDGES